MPNADFFTAFGLFVRRGFLDRETCDALREEMLRSPARASTVAEQSDDAVDESYRKTVSAQVSDGTRSAVERRFEDLIPVLSDHFHAPVTRFQRPQFLRYREGDFFRPHADHEDEGPEYVRERRVSAVIFVNGESADPHPSSYGGGSLTFFGLMGDPRGDGVGFPLSAEPGLLVAFPSALLHSVSPIEHGERFTVVTWFA